MNQIFDSLHDYVYTALGICIGLLIGRFTMYIQMRKENANIKDEVKKK